MTTQTHTAVREAIATARRLEAAGDFPAAVQGLATLLATSPADRDVLLALAKLSDKMGNAADALALIQTALHFHPGDAEIQLELAAILEKLGRAGETRTILERLATARPADPRPLLRLSYFHRRYGDHEAAERICNRLVAGHPSFAMGWVSHGISDYTAGRAEAAEASFQRALWIDDANPVAHFGRAANLLSQGHWGEGFTEFEWRRRLPDAGPAPVEAPVWTGREAPGTRVLLWNDQGLGDAMQFLRYVPLIAAKGHQPILLLPKALVRLAATAPGVGIVVAEGDPQPAVDAHLPLMSAPFALDCGDTIPADVPYLHADPHAAAFWRRRFGDQPGLRVGLVWSGASRAHNFQLNAIDRRRSLALVSLLPLLQVPGVRFVSLQKGDPAAQIAELPPSLRPLDFMDEVTDFADTAALVANLDLVISVDTSVVHLAGALGKKVWILSRYDGCWRWMRDREDSPWYPTARLFRQSKPGDWDEVVGRVASALAEIAG